MSLHTEVNFENEICASLAAHGWLHDKADSVAYDRARALFAPDVVAWVRASQPQAWDALVKSHGSAAEAMLLDRLRKQLDERGTLDVLRHGIEMLGLRGPLLLAQFKPAMGMNPDITARYAANRLRVVRQLRYSLHNENCIDLVLFLNGIPVATCELKTDFTQSVEDAVDQYRFDRQPRPKGQPAPEPLLDFPRGALVHFAVSNREVRMTTRLQGTSTRFLPFNQGDQGAAGNPLNPDGHPTAYLWERVWDRDSWLEILGRYLVVKRDEKKRIDEIIFPRFHQLDVTRRLVEAVRTEGAGGRYLIQHSAGSGKTNSIAWTAHFLAELHDANDVKVFDSVLVVSDRTVLDSQLQEAIFDFQRTKGVVARIDREHGAKSAQLAEALKGDKKIVVCTIQTFPKALEKVQELAATEGKRFAVIADEAHSSQTGEAASKLKQVLSAAELQDLADGGEISNEDVLAAQMAARAKESGITYVAFTATPKAKTLELFGRRPHPDQPAGDGNLPQPFHVYSMRQAIEEGFILDVLKNYTPYSLAFRLAGDPREFTDRDVKRNEAMKGLMRWVRLHDYNIAQKVQVVVEHYRENVAPLLEGRAKAMVVVASRLEAVRWKLAMEKYIQREGYAIGTLVAFSGEVHDEQSGPEDFSEHSKVLNPGLNGRDIREAFKTSEFHLLLVANKFQTGFDQPLLCGMYVDKRLAGIQAVQTLSRLNRAAPGKDTTYILDFVNEPQEILASFRTYYETAELSGVTDPNLIYDLRARLDAQGHYDEFEIDRVVKAELDPKGTQGALAAAVGPVADRLLKQHAAAKRGAIEAQSSGDAAAQAARDTLEALALFKRDLATYIRVYTFLSQIFDYGNTALEKRAIFFKRLLPLLEFGRERETVDLSKIVMTHHRLKDRGNASLNLASGKAEKLAPLGDAGTGAVQEAERERLSAILARMNELFEGDLTEGDMLSYAQAVRAKLLESELLQTQARNNEAQRFGSSPDLDGQITEAAMDASDAHQAMSRQVLESKRVRDGLKDILLGPGRLYEALRAVQQDAPTNPL